MGRKGTSTALAMVSIVVGNEPCAPGGSLSGGALATGAAGMAGGLLGGGAGWANAGTFHDANADSANHEMLFRVFITCYLNLMSIVVG